MKSIIIVKQCFMYTDLPIIKWLDDSSILKRFHSISPLASGVQKLCSIIVRSVFHLHQLIISVESVVEVFHSSLQPVWQIMTHGSLTKKLFLIIQLSEEKKNSSEYLQSTVENYFSFRFFRSDIEICLNL